MEHRGLRTGGTQRNRVRTGGGTEDEPLVEHEIIDTVRTEIENWGTQRIDTGGAQRIETVEHRGLRTGGTQRIENRWRTEDRGGTQRIENWWNTGD